MRAPFFTVMTPTFNRAHTLGRVFESLLAQTGVDFEWLVVDDGSTDNTAQEVAQWQQHAPFPVRYVWQPNRHKKAAFNHGVREARGSWLVALDSDDALEADALAQMQAVIASLPTERQAVFFAVTGLCARPDGRIVGDLFPKDGMDASVLDMVFRYRVAGEKFGCMRTEVLRRFPFPEDVPGFVPESLVWRAIARAGYLSRHVNQVFRVYHDSGDSLSRQGVDGGRHALGLWLLAQDTLCHCMPWFRYWPKAFLLAAARYTRFGMHLRHDGQALPEMPPLSGQARVLCALMWPVGAALYWRDRRQKGGPAGA
ncbi:glycosyltransferase family 2 protein [Pusillimonas sp. CC-YST705]|uniref:Glycosyltransferase family 2 protein n=1 Tax=Mesopusillimonas faecipullorum TaxID=2755040 RepID=A0ABS8CA43_9BURK|nr:glycosyltransferase family A protein [Mesopusillimonas faecipullorum]MCB5362499.1 glycosyltransferase family 2 protein [Mesopusillimonas faecipullorum]